MLSEGATLTGETGKKYLAVSPLGQSNVWTAVEQSNDPKKPVQVVVIKEPGEVDTEPGWPSFQNEMIMHEVFKDSPAIRQQLDRIPPLKAGDPPMIVLEITETTLWGARTKRPMSLAEIKTVAKDVLVGLRDVHAQGLVYADLKPQNIMVDGFNAESEGKDDHLKAKLGDLGLVMEPMNGKVQPISYRAPEVYLKGDITSRVDVWGWALIYCHLLEARTRFSKTGLYDDLDTKSGGMKEREDAVKSALTNDYKLQNEPVYGSVPLPQNDPTKHKGDQWELLRQRGLEDGEVDFLRWVLKADPYQRPSVNQILESGWLDKTAEEVAASGFTPPEFEFLEYDPKRATPDEFAAQEKQEASNNKQDQGNYFGLGQTQQQTRPAMTEKRYHSAEDEVPVKKMYVPDAKLTAPAEQQQAGPASTAIPTQPTQTSTSAVQPTQFQSAENSSTSTSALQPTPFKDVSSYFQDTAAPSPFSGNGSMQSNVAATPFKSMDTTETTTIPSSYTNVGSTGNKMEPTPFTNTTTIQDASAPVSFTNINESSVSSAPQRPPLNTTNTGTFLSYQ
ncbi:kinase-like protein [Aureobasidium pullulans]|nr:kinase-like protein [Aureobasidium pullulans]